MVPTKGGDLVHFLCFKKAVPDAESHWKFDNGEKEQTSFAAYADSGQGASHVLHVLVVTHDRFGVGGDLVSMFFCSRKLSIFDWTGLLACVFGRPAGLFVLAPPLKVRF